MITCPKSTHILNNGILEFLFDDPVLLTSPPDEGTLRTHVPGNKKQSSNINFQLLELNRQQQKMVNIVARPLKAGIV
jgi:hypothetical protein